MAAQLNHPVPKKPSAIVGSHLVSSNGGTDHTFASGASTPASISSPGRVSAEVYFASHVPPKSLKENAEKIRAFVDKHMRDGRRVVLVTVS